MRNQICNGKPERAGEKLKHLSPNRTTVPFRCVKYWK
jgi:hypothetical protein